MSDLIERKAVLHAIESASCWGHTFNALCDEARDITAVDAVPVVRCKDCCYFNAEGRRLCSLIDGLCGADSDDFCSYGERKMR